MPVANYYDLTKLSVHELRSLYQNVSKELLHRASKRKAQPAPETSRIQSDAYKDGFASGYTWDANWVPGGPHKKAINASWLEGWRAGLDERLSTNKRFARWWKEKRRSGRERYHETIS
jgi:hypothetical protein